MITYNGKHYEEFTADKNILFDLPKRAIFWDTDGDTYTTVCDNLVAYFPGRTHPAIAERNSWRHCALLPEPRRATKRELSMWLAKGKGEVCIQGCNSASPCYAYDPRESEEKVPNLVMIRTWDDVVWHEPTADYMGLDE